MAELQGTKRSSSASLLPVSIAILRPNGRVPNTIITSKYTLATFVPTALYELLSPFKRFANFFYLVVGALQTQAEINPSGSSTPTVWASLFMILNFDLFCLAKDDLGRHRADRVTNSQPVSIIAKDASDAQGVIERPATWADVQVGDVVRVRNKEAFPADMVLLRGSDPPGTCWVSTKALDGESDMKLRLAPQHGLLPALGGHADDSVGATLGSASAKPPRGSNEAPPPPLVASTAAPSTPGELAAQLRWEGLAGELRCEEPNDKVNDFVGELHLDGGAKVPIGPTNMLLRGCVLHNTEWVLGLVVATGTDTKINHGSIASSMQKHSIVSKTLNKMVVLEILLCVLMCIIGTICSQTDYGLPAPPWYIVSPDDDNAPTATIKENPFKMLLMYFLMFYSMLPATLFASSNIIYLWIGNFMRSDLDMYHAEADEPCQVRQMTLVDELGQVSHIFSDKTGTLTSNHMEFRRCLIDGVAYGVGETAISLSLRELGRAPAAAASSTCSSSSVGAAGASAVISPAAVELSEAPTPGWAGCRPATSAFVSFEEAAGAPSLYEALEAEDADGVRRRELMVHMAVNQSVLLDEGHLSASSPDELAFVAAAEHFGFEFCARRDAEGEIAITDKRLGVTHTIGILAVFAYESSRKRMSVVVQLPPALLRALGGGAPVRLYTKGADSVLLTLLAPGSRGSDPEALGVLSEQLAQWADVALRTLVFAKRELADAEYAAWNAQYEEATSDPAQLLALRRGEPNKISALQVELEASLVMQGATAIEDKLQHGVPEVLRDLRAAQIKLWMLTGDKVGTAKNIATACNILPLGADVLELTAETYPVLGEVSATRMVEIQRIVERALEQAMPDDAAQGGRLAQLLHRAKHALGSRVAEEASRAAVARVIQEQTDKLDAKHPKLMAVRAALELRLRQMDDEARRANAAKGSGAAAGALSSREFCLVLDESAIEYCATLCKDALAQVGNGARSVVACRARKDQKAQMLQLIRDYVPESCTLAIGDGANDVAMIKAGQIGVGIIGKEGMAAVNNSDFAIGQFRFLRSLLLVHGRSNYRRVALFSYYVLYKGTVICASIFFYTVSQALGSANNPYSDLFHNILYSIFLTIAPIIVIAVNDTDVPKEVAARSPELYTPGIRRVHFTIRGFFGWSLDGLWAAAVSIFVPMLAVQADPDGWFVDGRWSLSWLAMWLLTLGVGVRIWLEVHSWTVLEYAANTVSIGLLVFWALVMSYVDSISDSAGFSWVFFKGLMQRFFPMLYWWLVVLFGVTLFQLPTLLRRSWATMQRPPPPPQSKRKPSNLEPVDAPVPRTRKSLMAVPPEEAIQREEQEQHVRRTSLMRGSLPAGAEAGATPSEGSAGARPRASFLRRDETFSCHDSTSNLVWELQNTRRVSMRKSLAASSGSSGHMSS